MLTILRSIFTIYLLALTYLSLSHSSEGSLISSYYLTDTGIILHFGAYFICSFLAIFAFVKKNLLKSLLFVLFFSTVLEIIQYFLPYRTFNLLDILANISGIFLFGICYYVILDRPIRLLQTAMEKR